MSSKHIKALSGLLSLAGQLKKLDDQHVDEDYDSENETDDRKSSAFLALNDETDSSDSNENSDSEESSEENEFEEEGESTLKVDEKEKKGEVKGKGALAEDFDEIEYLNSVLKDCKEDSTKSSIGKKKFQFLSCDAFYLDIDAVMRKRFGGASLHDENNEENMNLVAEGRKKHRKSNNGKKNRMRRIIENETKKKVTLHRKLIFGSPKDDWPQPSSFVNGGICMKEVSQKMSKESTSGFSIFEIQWSDDYRTQHNEFVGVQGSGDANQLCYFISRHPNHSEALLQLAMVFARTGQMDRASELVRRCLYILETSHSEKFKPFAEPCLLDISREENKVYFSSLFRHMQISGMLGCPKVASAVGKYLLSLDPWGDPLGTLLFLDHYFISCGNFDDIKNFCNTDTFCTLFPDLCEEHIHGIDDILPNWALTACLGMYFEEVESGEKHLKPKSSNVLAPECIKMSPSQMALVKACKRFPFMIPMAFFSIKKVDKFKRNWDQVFSHPYFVTFATQDSMADVVGSGNSKVLTKLGSLFRARSIDCGSSSLWKKVDVVDWFYDTLCCFVEDLEDDTIINEVSWNQTKASFFIFLFRLWRSYQDHWCLFAP